MKDFDRDYWMDAKEAIEYGIVDKISKSCNDSYLTNLSSRL